MDVSAEEGQAASKDLQKEFSQRNIQFLLADVTKQEDLVGKIIRRCSFSL